jgi:hypothetical protein
MLNRMHRSFLGGVASLAHVACAFGLPACGGRVLATDGADAALASLSVDGAAASCSSSLTRACTGGTAPDLVREKGNILHWRVGDRCISTSIAGELAGRRDELVQALHAWSSLSCSHLCLAEPTIEADVASGILPTSDPCERRLLFAPQQSPGQSGYELISSWDTGEVFGAIVYVSGATPTSDVGNALGIASSLLGGRVVDANGDPTQDAIASYCELYGARPLCQ